jgi:hypothetical protein
LIYDTQNQNLVSQYKGSGAFCLFSNYLIGMYANPGIVLKDFLTNEHIFESSNYSTGSYFFVHHNEINNTLVYGGGILRALDLNKILTGVPELQEKNILSVQYQKGILLLTNLNLVSNQINITISDINGRVINRFDSQVTNSELKIPIKLINGTYLLYIQDKNNEYSSKFLVTE